MEKELLEKFLTNTDDTGRFIITSKRTGKTYAVEPIGDPRKDWGDVDPATGRIMGNYGGKYQGSIREKDSLIKEENGFINIELLKPGVSPFAAIEALDSQYPELTPAEREVLDVSK